jgi:hypothetical protein
MQYFRFLPDPAKLRREARCSGVSSVRRLLQSRKCFRWPEAVRQSHQPGQQAQLDLGPGSSQNRVAIRIADAEFLDYLNARIRLRTQMDQVELLVELSCFKGDLQS